MLKQERIKCCVKSLSSGWRCHVQLHQTRHKYLSRYEDIGALCRKGSLEEVLGRLHRGDIIADINAYASILRACGDSKRLSDLAWVHQHMVSRGFQENTFLRNLLVDIYGKCRSLEDARSVFDGILQKNVFSWNAIIAAYLQNEHAKDAIELFYQMQYNNIEPDSCTFVNILCACANWPEGKLIHAFTINKKFEANVVVGTGLLTMYGKCNRVDDARAVFDKLNQKDLVSWNAMLSVYAHSYDCREGFHLFEQMNMGKQKANKITFLNLLETCIFSADLPHGIFLHAVLIHNCMETDILVRTSLVSMHGKCGNLEGACQVFYRATKCDIVLWNSMIFVYTLNGYCKEAIQLMDALGQESLKPNNVTFISALDACSNMADLAKGTLLHACIISRGICSGTILENALISLYGNCAKIDAACQVFDIMAEQDVVSWNAILHAYIQHRHYMEAIDMFQQMHIQNMPPDDVTVTSVLEACANVAALSKGMWIHNQILNTGLQSDVFVGTALINMYGKCGDEIKANEVFNKAAQQDTALWNAIITACVLNGNAQGAIKHFHAMQTKGVKLNKVTFISVLSVCSHVGLLCEGHHYFSSLSANHGITPAIEHYGCIIDLLGRAGQLTEAEDLTNASPLESNTSEWTTLLGASTLYGNKILGAWAAEHAFEMDPGNSVLHISLLNLYAAS